MISAFNETQRSLIATHVEKADTVMSRIKGLLGKKTMPRDYGLWISPCKSIHTFFMRFPIDVIFLSSDHHVVKIIPSIAPFRMSSLVISAQSVLELAAGSVQNSGTQVGDQVVFRS